jgi:hypothetical protein
MAQCRKIGGRFAKKTERVCSEILRNFNGISEVAEFRMRKEQYYSYLVCNFISFKVDHRHPNFHPDEVLDVVEAKARASEVEAIEDMLEEAMDQRQPLTIIKSGGGYEYVYLCGVKVNKLLWDLVKHVGVEPGNGWVFSTEVSDRVLVFEAPFISGVVAGFKG